MLITSQRNPFPLAVILIFPQPLATPSLLSVSVCLPVLDTSRDWYHTVNMWSFVISLFHFV